MKPNIILLIWQISLSMLSAQAPTDSIIHSESAFKNAAWQVQLLAPQILWASYHFKNKEIFHANQFINIIKYQPKHTHTSFVSAYTQLIPTSQLASSDTHVIAAINGTFFDMKKGGSVDFIKINHQILDTSRLSKGKQAEHQLAALVIDSTFRISIVVGDSMQPHWAHQLTEPNVMVTGPLLLKAHQERGLKKTAFNQNRHPRSCVCITEQEEVIWITVDGRNTLSQGVTLPELGWICKWLGCRDAINLDGGGSTSLYVRGQPFNGVVNMPSDNHQFDHFGERHVSNIIVLKQMHNKKD